jgi:hypothetical protein
MVFENRLKPYKITTNYVKSLGVVVMSLGFSVKEVERGNLSFRYISEAIGLPKP